MGALLCAGLPLRCDFMNMVLGVLSAVFWGLLVLSVLVLVHEGGHFLAARAFGMRVTEFYLGLPCRFHVCKKSERFGTEFGVTPVLLGGYNRICGMEGEEDELLPRALGIVQREGRAKAADLATELGIELEDAYALLAVLADMGSIRPYYNPELDEQPWQKEWPEAFETLARDGMLLTEYDSDHDFSQEGSTAAGEPRPITDEAGFYAQEAAQTYKGKGFVPRVVTLLAGPLVNILLAFVLLVGSFMAQGVRIPLNTNVLGGVVEGSYAEAAGLKEGDTILKIDDQDVNNWMTLADAATAGLRKGGDIRVAYIRDGLTAETTVELPEGGEAESIGFLCAIETRHLTFGEALISTMNYLGTVGSTVARILMPQHTMEIVGQSSSVVGISAMASQAAATGLLDFLFLAAAISVSLGFMNLLPIPPLDGGKILIEIVQLIIRRPLSTRAQNIVSYVGLAFFLFIFCFAVRNDIMRLLGLM